MTDVDRERLWQFLASTWYQRTEDDDAIIAELVSQEYLREQDLSNVRAFLDSPESVESKAAFIRGTVFRYPPPEDDPTVPLRWLAAMVKKIEARSVSQGGYGRDS